MVYIFKGIMLSCNIVLDHENVNSCWYTSVKVVFELLTEIYFQLQVIYISDHVQYFSRIRNVHLSQFEPFWCRAKEYRYNGFLFVIFCISEFRSNSISFFGAVDVMPFLNMKHRVYHRISQWFIWYGTQRLDEDSNINNIIIQ